MNKELADFENEVLYNVMLGTTTPKVIDSRGHTPLIACLESETVGTLLARIERAGGCGTIYALSETGRVRVVAAQDKDSKALSPTDLEADTLSENSPIGMLIDYISTQEDGVYLTGAKMRSYGTADLAKV
ncbi:MAG: hypothetical protein E6468_08795 [Varibaculum cambriense]|uniref:hypothetical protein n=1 Tax=Varibaculum cambriense TaxID=184870 RepID=UPI0029099EC7|nr:hypothetical protein [Varibaculum cambriense]MDU6681922.1 hypothetical protein [Varibaculum cambriense]